MTMPAVPSGTGGLLAGAVDDPFDVRQPAPRTIMLRRARSHPGFLFGVIVLVLFAAMAIFAPLLAPADPYVQDLSRRLINPVWGANGSWAHIFGTDGYGRDFLSRIIYGSRIALMIGFFAALISGIIGTALGLTGGYFGGWVDSVVVYVINVKLALPIILVALALSTVIGGSTFSLIMILGFLSWDRFAVVTRSIAQQLRSAEFIVAARAAGATQKRVIFRELLPNILNQIIVVASIDMALDIAIAAVLSFLGLGVRAPQADWGLMIAEGRSYMFFKPYLIVLPGLALFILVVAINMLGDGIRDITAPEGRS
jgi:peptide/nickel transport system permease protein